MRSERFARNPIERKSGAVRLLGVAHTPGMGPLIKTMILVIVTRPGPQRCLSNAAQSPRCIAPQGVPNRKCNDARTAVVVPTPSLAFSPRIVEAHEPMCVQTFRSEFAIERLNESIVSRLAGSGAC
jgi:hypothetical protein